MVRNVFGTALPCRLNSLASLGVSGGRPGKPWIRDHGNGPILSADMEEGER